MSRPTARTVLPLIIAAAMSMQSCDSWFYGPVPECVVELRNPGPSGTYLIDGIPVSFYGTSNRTFTPASTLTVDVSFMPADGYRWLGFRLTHEEGFEDWYAPGLPPEAMTVRAAGTYTGIAAVTDPPWPVPADTTPSVYDIQALPDGRFWIKLLGATVSGYFHDPATGTDVIPPKPIASWRWNAFVMTDAGLAAIECDQYGGQEDAYLAFPDIPDRSWLIRMGTWSYRGMHYFVSSRGLTVLDYSAPWQPEVFSFATASWTILPMTLTTEAGSFDALWQWFVPGSADDRYWMGVASYASEGTQYGLAYCDLENGTAAAYFTDLHPWGVDPSNGSLIGYRDNQTSWRSLSPDGSTGWCPDLSGFHYMGVLDGAILMATDDSDLIAWDRDRDPWRWNARVVIPEFYMSSYVKANGLVQFNLDSRWFAWPQADGIRLYHADTREVRNLAVPEWAKP